MRRLLSILFFLASSQSGFSQVTDSVQNSGSAYFSFVYDNDFFSATDRYYTQGIILSLVHPSVRRSPFTFILLKLKKATTSFHGIHLEQDVFTPRSIRYMGGSIYRGERPFTATLFLSQSLSACDNGKKAVLHSQIDIGILGPFAFGKQTQTGIHDALDNIKPLGWDNQLSQDIILNYRARVEKGILVRDHFELMGAAAGRLGTLYTDVSVGVHARFGILNPYFNTLGWQNKSNSRKKFTVTLVGKSNVKAVAYNATLQGGISNNENKYDLPDESLNRIIAEVYGGLLIGYKNLFVEYSRTYITKEFEEGLDHGWGRWEFVPDHDHISQEKISRSN